ncbi:MAG: hypothetical protein U5K27_04730 [Desulfotignum sp.]|nr:hypothetical protein [Desulfotignum sp.]
MNLKANKKEAKDYVLKKMKEYEDKLNDSKVEASGIESLVRQIKNCGIGNITKEDIQMSVEYGCEQYFEKLTPGELIFFDGEEGIPLKMDLFYKLAYEFQKDFKERAEHFDKMVIYQLYKELYEKNGAK